MPMVELRMDVLPGYSWKPCDDKARGGVMVAVSLYTGEALTSHPCLHSAALAKENQRRSGLSRITT